ncbi:DUF5711 family protein [Acetivibrio straminisolvens]|uniref:DUF5711 family protein n=1 Tax=Acetivibrio straminisolvens TaxID=253314 RepID=UPI0005704D8B|nr:DUF5711 family protein [Acetivibrio straminisolvens]
MNSPENISKTRQPSSRMSILLFFILIIVVVCTAAVAYLNSKGIDIKSISVRDVIANGFFIGDKDVYEVTGTLLRHEDSLNSEFEVHKSYIVRCTKNGIEYLDRNGEEQWIYPVSLNTPSVKTSGEYLLASGLESKDIYVLSGKERKWEKRLDYNIINANINSAGYVTVLHKGDRDKSAVSVFNKQGVFLFTKVLGETYAISSEVSPSGKEVLINCVDTSGISINTGLHLYTISGGIVSGKTFEDVIFPSIRYLNDDTIVAASDSAIYLFGRNLEEKWKKEISGKVFSLDIMKGKYAVFAYSDKGMIGTAGHVLIVDAKGREVADYKIGQDIVNIAANDDFIAVNTSKCVYFIDVAGRLRGSYTSDYLINEVKFLGSNEALAITKEGVIVLKMN